MKPNSNWNQNSVELRLNEELFETLKQIEAIVFSTPNCDSKVDIIFLKIIWIIVLIQMTYSWRTLEYKSLCKDVKMVWYTEDHLSSVQKLSAFSDVLNSCDVIEWSASNLHHFWSDMVHWVFRQKILSEIKVATAENSLNRWFLQDRQRTGRWCGHGLQKIISTSIA